VTEITRAGHRGSPCNPSYSGGRDQENHGSEPAWANRSRDLSQNPFIKIGVVEWLKVKALSSSLSTTKKENITGKSWYLVLYYIKLANLISQIFPKPLLCMVLSYNWPNPNNHQV
jgi:hypothetical protein